MTALPAILILVAALRLAELFLARHNTRRLLAQGAVEVGAGHYPLMVALHTGWLVSMISLIPWDTAPSPWGLAVFTLLMAARIWVIVSLGPFWTTRIITLPKAELVRRGPYRFLRHPNYLVVAGEIAVLPLSFGAWEIALVFSLLNGLILTWRIRHEERALAPRR